MRLSAFIVADVDAIVDEWERFARTLLPVGKTMTVLALRDHCRDMLLSIANDMETPETAAERSVRAQGGGRPSAPLERAAEEHGALRQLAGFDLVQLVAEFRALRASVLTRWHHGEGAGTATPAIEEIMRFNEGIDDALAESVERYSRELAASRDMFLAMLGHDLRGPLSGIDMSTLLLGKPDLPEELRHKALIRIKRASGEMNRLVTDLLEYTRTRLGRGIPIERSDCDLGPLCEEALEAIRAGHPEQHFLAELSGDLSIEADAPRIQQVLANLLNNAVQHGDRSVPVLLSAEGEEGAIVLKVANAGQPIRADALSAIFEPLVQAPSEGADSHQRSRTSLGLGLFIVREIVLGHGGTIDVESSAGSGTVFTIRLPRGRRQT
ncbi:MAG: sensor histidine kinase [Pseudomonadota bacterium]|nr:sensor histidine kinase [Pseudomonadota bacterium]